MKKFNPVRLTQARLWNDFSMDHLAGMVGVTKASIGLYERGGRNPDGAIQIKLANALNFPIDFFYTSSIDTSMSQISYRKKANTLKRGKQRADLLKQFSFEFTQLLSDYVTFKDSCIFPKDIPFEQLSTNEIEKISLEARKELNAGMGPIQNLMTFLENRGAFIFLYDNTIAPVDGFSCIGGGRPYIYINKDYSWDRIRFTLAHELGHIFLHSGIDESEKRSVELNKLMEKQANFFAGAFLIPKKSFITDFISPTKPFLFEMKRKWGMSMGGVVMRAYHLGLITRTKAQSYFSSASRKNERKEEIGKNLRENERPFVIASVINSLIQNNIVDKFFLKSYCAFPDDLLKILSSEILTEDIQENLSPFIVKLSLL